MYALANLQASIGTVKAAGTADDLNGAVGLKAVLLDRSDPMLDTTITEALAQGIRDNCRPDQPGEGPKLACIDSVTAAVLNTSESKHRWNETQLAIAVAVGTHHDGGRIDRIEYNGMDAWLVGAFPLGPRLQLLAQAT